MSETETTVQEIFKTDRDININRSSPIQLQQQKQQQRPTWEILAAAMDASLYAPFEDAVHGTNTPDTNTVIETPIATTTTGNNYYENILNEPTIITAVNTISKINTTNKEKKKQKKTALQTRTLPTATHMPTIIEEEPNHDEVHATTTTTTEEEEEFCTTIDEYNQLCTRLPGYDTECINYLQAGQEIHRQMEIMDGLAGKLPNYI